MDEPGDEIDWELIRIRARLEPGRVGAVLAWAVVQPDDVLDEYGLPLSQDERFELAAWAIGLARWRP
jgi:hypothetical protein